MIAATFHTPCGVCGSRFGQDEGISKITDCETSNSAELLLIYLAQHTSRPRLGFLCGITSKVPAGNFLSYSASAHAFCLC
jgi:hypothetical protein